MSTKSNRALVTRFYSLMSQLDFEAMFRLMDDHGTWTVAGNPELFHHSGVSSKRERMQALSAFTRYFSSLNMEICSLTAEEDRVAAEIFTRCTTHEGLQYQNELLVLIRCRDGKIVSIYEHLDQQTSLEFERRLADASGITAH